LRHLDLAPLEAEILNHLIEGRKTAVELVDGIFAQRRGDPGYHASYLKLLRSLRRLERSGLASTRLLGRDKPYRVTRHGIAVLASIAPDTDPPRILGPHEATALLLTMVCGITLWICVRGSPVGLGSGLVLSVYALFFSLLGYSISLLVRMVRSVS
jgi:hypothetical protein